MKHRKFLISKLAQHKRDGTLRESDLRSYIRKFWNPGGNLKDLTPKKGDST